MQAHFDHLSAASTADYSIHQPKRSALAGGNAMHLGIHSPNTTSGRTNTAAVLGKKKKNKNNRIFQELKEC